MGLNIDLVSQFAKLTANKKETKKESTAWGEVVEITESGKTFVRLDGSDRVTPVDTITEAKVGDRVSVTIKNHAATLTGNASSPSINADGSTVGTIRNDFKNLSVDNLLIREKLTASEGYIAELTAKNLTVEETLKAHTGKFEYVEAGVGEFNRLKGTFATFDVLNAKDAEIRNLLADYATIENLNANRAEITELLAGKATIADLTAIQGTIGSLDAGIADIKTLIFGTASGTSIHTNFANAVIAQLGDAQIKSAMIQDISAGKITSGEIITDNVKVKSNDGKLLIADQTIQISDSTRVRVQIGKDAENDYSINIWDANGKLMFSEGGLTEDAVKKQIIRNDMVKDDANISASKLDINTLFNVINEDGSHTLKSNKIKLDEQNQTLDVAFGALTTKVNGQAETISSQGTAISVIQGNISSKIWQQDIISAIGGGINLVRNTKNPSNNSYWTRGNIVKDADLNENVFYMTNSSTAETTSGTYRIKVTSGEWYTVSALVKRTANVKSVDFFFLSRKESDTTDFVYIQNKTNMVPEADKWIRLTWSFQMYSEAEEGYLRIDHNGSNDGTEAFLYYTNVKVEKGQKATDWSPAPEDIDSKINTKYSTLEQTIDGITTTVGSHTTKINGLTTNIESAMTRIKETEDNITLCATKTELEESYSKGRNLLRNTGGGGDIFMAYEGTSPAAKNIQSRNNTDGIFTLNASTTNDEIYYRFMQVQPGNLYGLVPGETYTLAGKVRITTTNGAFESLKVRSQHNTGGGWTSGTTDASARIITSDTDEWVDFETSFTVVSNATGYFVSFQLYYPGDSLNQGSWSGTIQFKELKLERGNKHTPWALAPEDISGYYSKTQTDAQIQLTANSITQTVSETYATQNSLTSAISEIQQTSDSIKLSVEKISRTGRNLARDTSQKDTEIGGYPTSGYYDDGSFTGRTTIIPSGNEYVVSFEAKSTVNDDEIRCYFYSPNTTTGVESSQGYNGTNSDGSCQIYLSTEWRRYWVKWTQEGAATTSQKNYIIGRRVAGYGSGTVSIRCVKLEEGHDPTPWSAAPEDARSNFANDSSNVTITNGAITFETGTLLINAGNFTLDANGNITATNATLEGTVTTTSNNASAKLTSGSLALYRDGKIYGAISSKYHTNANNSGLAITVRNSGSSGLMFVAAAGDDLFGTSYEILYQMQPAYDTLQYCYSTDSGCQHTFHENVRFTGMVQCLSPAYFRQVIYLGPNAVIGWQTSNDGGSPDQFITFDTADQLFNVGSRSYNTVVRGKYAEIYATADARFHVGVEQVILEGLTSVGTYSGYFFSINPGTCCLGKSANRWYRLYAVNECSISSDRRLKENIESLSDVHSSLFDKLQPVQYNFIQGDGRTHYGLIAQDVISAMAELGIDENDLDLVQHDMDVNETGELNDTYGMAYGNLIPMLIHEVQKLKKEIKTLKGE